MEKISFNKNISITNKLPVSFFELSSLPSSSFKVGRYIMGEPWKEMAIHSIYFVIVKLLLDGIVELEKASNQKKIFFNLILWKLSKYKLTIKNTENSIEESHSWLEKKLMNAIECNQEKYLRDIIKTLLDSILGVGDKFVNPSRMILARIIIESETNLWNYKVDYEKYLFSSKTHPYKVELIIKEDIKNQIRFAKEEFKNSLNILFDNVQFKELDFTVRKIITSEIEKRHEGGS